MIGIRRAGARRRRRAFGALAAAAALLVVWCPAEPAGAAITTFTMAPEAGPPGTVVHVHGRGCGPGLLASRQTNFVTVSAATLGVVFRAPVRSDGTWKGSFTVPANGTAAFGSSTPVTATCVSTGLASLATIYPPRSFSVTAASSPPPTGPGAPPTTGEPSDGTVVIPGDTTTVISVPPNDDGVSGDDTSGRVEAQGSEKPTAAKRDPKLRGPEPATLLPAGMDTRSAAGTGASGLGWLGWTLLLILLVAALGASGLVWRARHLPDSAEDGAQ